MEDPGILDFILKAGAWPWVVLILILLTLFGYRFKKIDLPGGGGFELGERAPRAFTGYDSELRTSSANIAWSTHFNPQTNAVVPSSTMWVKPLPGIEIVPDVHFSIRQQFAVANAIRETLDIGRLGETRRYEVTPLAPEGGGSTLYVEITPVRKMVGNRPHLPAGGKSVNVVYRTPAGEALYSFHVNAAWSSAHQTWIGEPP